MPEREGFWIYEWEEECSAFTPGAHWVGLDYRAVTCRMWIPNSITGEDYAELEDYIDKHCHDPEAYVE
jgi:hypothetical protein